MNRIFCALLFGIVSAPAGLRAQAASGGAPARVSWPLIDFIVIGDSVHGVQLLASPNFKSAQGAAQSQAASLTFQPRAARIWAAGIAQVVESIARLPEPARKPFSTLALTAYHRTGWMRLSRGPEAKSDSPFDLEVFDSTSVADPAKSVGWAIPASPGDLLSFVTTLDQVAENSVLDSAAQVADSGTFREDEVDRLPEFHGIAPVQYPANAVTQKRQGRVWLEFVIDSSGAALASSARVLLTDGDEFTQAVVAALPQMHFTPALRRGAHVRMLAREPFLFTLPKLTTVPFARAP